MLEWNFVGMGLVDWLRVGNHAKLWGCESMQRLCLQTVVGWELRERMVGLPVGSRVHSTVSKAVGSTMRYMQRHVCIKWLHVDMQRGDWGPAFWWWRWAPSVVLAVQSLFAHPSRIKVEDLRHVYKLKAT